MPRFFRSDQATIGVSIPGVAFDQEPWDLMQGFDPEVTTLKIHPGGGPAIDLGGIAVPSIGTVARFWTDNLAQLYKELHNAAGQLPATVTYSVGRPAIGVVFTYTGTLGTVTRPNYKSGTAEEALLQITVGPNAQIS